MTVDRILNKSSFVKTMVVDACMLILLYYLPTLSHLIAIPLYCFEPMRIALFISVLFLHDRKNAFFLAITLPLFSYVVSGHPVAIKSIIIAIELLVNVWLFNIFYNKNINIFLSCFTSIVVSKLFYYGLKYIVMRIGLLKTDFIDTSFLLQLLISIILSIVFYVSYKRIKN